MGGENRYHVIFGGGPSYAVHPSNTAVALVALNASFVFDGPKGARTVRITWIESGSNSTSQLIKRFVLRGGACVEDKAFGVLKLHWNWAWKKRSATG